MSVMPVTCHCCGKPSETVFPICSKCIYNGGSIERKCSQHGPLKRVSGTFTSTDARNMRMRR